TQEGIYQHYKKVAESVGIPIIVYNIPARTGSKIEPETLARLSEIKNVAGVKEATGSVEQAIDVIRLCGDDLAVYSGEDSLTFSLMALGGKGVISTVANIVPKEMSQLTEACLKGNWESGRKLQLKLIPLIRSVFLETNPIPIKTALSLMGKCTGELRLPLTPMSEGNLKKTTTTDGPIRFALVPMALGLIVCGVGGRMGGAVVRAAAQTPGIRLAAAIDKPGSARLGKDAGETSAAGHLGVTISDRIEQHLKSSTVIIDFTNPEASLGYLRA